MVWTLRLPEQFLGLVYMHAILRALWAKRTSESNFTHNTVCMRTPLFPGFFFGAIVLPVFRQSGNCVLGTWHTGTQCSAANINEKKLRRLQYMIKNTQFIYSFMYSKVKGWGVWRLQGD
jgi:hypothetical protein